MLRLIESLLPAPLHRLALRAIYPIRHRWRQWRRVKIIGCNVIVTDLQGRILLLRHSYGPNCWSIPGGGVGRDEDPSQAARRELLEELRIELPNLKMVGILTGEISASPHEMHLFSAVTDARPKPDRREVVQARFYPPHSLPEPLGKSTYDALKLWREAQRNN